MRKSIIILIIVAIKTNASVLTDNMNMTLLENTVFPLKMFNDSSSYFTFSISPNKLGVNELDVISFGSTVFKNSKHLSYLYLESNQSNVFKRYTIESRYIFKYDEKLFLGISPNIDYFRIQNLFNKLHLNLKVSCLYKLDKDLQFAFEFRDILKDRTSNDQNENLELNLAISKRLNKKIAFELGSLIQIEQNNSLRLSILYRIVEDLSLRLNWQNNPQSISLDLNLNLGYFNTISSLSFNSNLGLSHRYFGEMRY